ncbi:MAG: GMC family oxidoreductase [Pseudomonadota bacterium]
MVDTFIDSREFPNKGRIDADICIIGAGAAGITIASQFVGTDKTVCLLEAGGLNVDPIVNSWSSVEDAGRPYGADYKRLRYFGGTTNHWGGQCGPLMPIDFEKRDWIPHSGWPYGYETLEPYYRRAHDVLRLGEFDYDASALAAEAGFQTFPFDPDLFRTVVSRYQRVRFGLEYGDALDKAPNIQTMLYADVSDILLAEDTGDTVSHVLVKSNAGNEFQVNAKHFVIAAGGIETPRLLLLANTQRPQGLGNEHDLVGRFFMEHIAFYNGHIAAPGDEISLPFYLREHPFKDIAIRGHLALHPDRQREQRMAGFRTEFITVNPLFESARRLRRNGIGADDVMSVFGDPVGLGHAFRCRSDATPTAYGLENYFEQVPNWNSRVTLSDKRDPAGRPLTRLDWKLSQQDHDCVVKAHNLLAREVGRSSFGRMRIEIEPEPEILLPGCRGGAHHMGTARMSDHPSDGVTDKNARVHSTTNLYVAGSALFPTVGWINPTMTIVATSLKLADHLKQMRV